MLRHLAKHPNLNLVLLIQSKSCFTPETLGGLGKQEVIVKLEASSNCSFKIFIYGFKS